MSCEEKKRQSYGDSSSEVETTIESLPDDVRRHIMSFLPTRDAAATALISKRWKPLWLSLASFDFNDGCFPDFRKFSYFVTSVLSSPHSVQSLRLTCGFHPFFNSSCPDFHFFLNMVALKGVHELDLGLVTLTRLPYSFYRCKTLVTLKLHNVILIDSSYVDFPLLKSLYLNDIKFGSQAIMFKFLCGCSNLEYLHARSLQFIGRDIPPQVEEGDKPLPKLVRARIIHSPYTPFPMLCNARFLRAGMNFDDRVYKPNFHNLIDMDLTFKYERCKVTWNWFAQVLHNCPKLQILTVYKNHACVNEVNEHWKDPQIVPKCLSTQLRTFTLRYYKGLKCETQFAKYIMQNSKLLQNMTIHTNLHVDIKDPILETFSLCPRGSATCNLRFDLQPAQHRYQSWL